MPDDILQSGLTWLGDQMRSHCAHLVTYRRGTQTASIFSTVGRTRWDQELDEGRVIEIESRDFLVTASELKLGGQVTLPKRGDQIIDDGQVFEVQSPSGETPYRYTDATRKRLRIHAKHVGAAA